MRFAWYAGASTALAASVVVSAFHQRANFYSAMVYLSQSNFCLLALINFIYLIYGTIMFGLQRLLYGSLRQVEVEQLSEKAWFAITETCLAMTIFRDEIGAWFLVMFTALITGKVWGWIGDGRVEILEQQPPANPSLFHTRLSISLLLSLGYDLWILNYSVRAVVQQARPDMMVMFLFEFAVLATSSARTAVRYLVSVTEHRIIKEQTKQRLEERRREVRLEREEIIRRREQEQGGESAEHSELPDPDDIDEMDIEVPGWENKGQWVLLLDLIADCTKFSIYIVFFFILFSFYGLPIHIMRDLFLTGRAVVKRGKALWKYRKAIEDMNKYPDATAEDLSREDTCIICREEMRPWDQANNPGALQRVRPKKLPCGHILHMGCLKSWLERQQVCPTCRRSVVIADPAPPNRDAVLRRAGLGGLGVPPAPNQQGQQGQQPPAQGGAAQPEVRDGGGGGGGGRGGPRVFNFGALRVGFAQGGENIQELAMRMGRPREANPPGAAPPTPPQDPTNRPLNTDSTGSDIATMRSQLFEVERNLQRQVQSLQQDHQQFQLVSLLFAELNRLHQLRRQQEQDPDGQLNGAPAPTPQSQLMALATQQQQQQSLPPLQPLSHATPHSGLRVNGPPMTRHGATASSSSIPAGSPDLPEGIVIPPGWSLMPLQRLDGAPVQSGQPSSERNPHAMNGNDAPGTAQSDSVEPSLGSRPTPSESETISAVNGSSSSPATQNETSGGPSTSNTAYNQSQQQQEQQQPEIIAPNPMLPNWSGENQLFGSRGGLGRDSSAPPSRDASVASQEQREQEAQKSLSAKEPEGAEEGGNSEASTQDKGKGKAVTVEDAEENEN